MWVGGVAVIAAIAVMASERVNDPIVILPSLVSAGAGPELWLSATVGVTLAPRQVRSVRSV